ncbi:MAG: DUF5989 family protein [Planctomycetia bacterium]
MKAPPPPTPPSPSPSPSPAPPLAPDEVARLAAAPRRGFLRELGTLLWRHKAWWLVPVLVLLLLVGALLVLASGPLGPFIYPLF